MNKKKQLAAVAAIALTAVSTANAAWKPGTAYYISEEDAYGYLEDHFDSAYCDGVSRFGKSGEFPYEEFHIFDCSVTMRGTKGYYCADMRFRSIKGAKSGYFRLKLVRTGECY